ncbi:N-acetylmuramoyl-L-alanine amidase [hydrothermal vent metagenome]|uniref:N-acetylmuramoyl-L-alanine amidase n=1 Tax=hydrothermal vent metagenome TaxID=652676 RepID=A0A3B0YS39_9ZZZZ
MASTDRSLGVSALLRLVWLSLLLLPLLAQAATTRVEGVRLWAAPDSTRIVFDISGPVSHRLLVLKKPNRLVIDLNRSSIDNKVKQSFNKTGLIKGLRSGLRNKKDLRLVLDLDRAVKPKSFLLKPNDQYGHRLVIDLLDASSSKRTSPVQIKVENRPAKLRDLVIAIDAGHGGEDPGARGKKGTREKVVVLQIAKRLAKLVDKEPGMRAMLVRSGDYYVGLRKRMEKARKHRADLFISIHADAFRNRSVRGASVYAVSRRGASSEMARWLAARENAADLVGGVSLDDKDDLLAEVLLDLAQTATLEASNEVASNVLREMRRIGSVHKKTVQHAGFVVLKSPDIPSLLVETAFISNPSEEQRLRSGKHQQKVAKAIMNGVRKYFTRNPPPGTLVAKASSRHHLVRRGDTLSHIAQRYGVTLASLRKTNSLRNDRLLVGKTLTIPSKGG